MKNSYLSNRKIGSCPQKFETSLVMPDGLEDNGQNNAFSRSRSGHASYWKGDANFRSQISRFEKKKKFLYYGELNNHASIVFILYRKIVNQIAKSEI